MRNQVQAESQGVVPGPGDDVTLSSPYGYMSYMTPTYHRIDNGAVGTIQKMNSDGSAEVKFRQGVRLSVPIHWLHLDRKGCS